MFRRGLHFSVSIFANLWADLLCRGNIYIGEYVTQIWNSNSIHILRYFFQILTIDPKVCSALLWLLYWFYMGKNKFEKTSPEEFFDAFLLIWMWKTKFLKMYSLYWETISYLQFHFTITLVFSWPVSKLSCDQDNCHIQCYFATSQKVAYTSLFEPMLVPT